MDEQFFVDERVGCIAVRDRQINNDSPGLWEDDLGVVGFWQGVFTTKRCPTCGNNLVGSWSVSEEVRRKATELCDQLNSKGKG